MALYYHKMHGVCMACNCRTRTYTQTHTHTLKRRVCCEFVLHTKRQCLCTYLCVHAHVSRTSTHLHFMLPILYSEDASTRERLRFHNYAASPRHACSYLCTKEPVARLPLNLPSFGGQTSAGARAESPQDSPQNTYSVYGCV